MKEYPDDMRQEDWERQQYKEAETLEPPPPSGELLEEMRSAALELAGYASYAEIVGAIGHNRSAIRKWCDKVFDINRKIESELEPKNNCQNGTSSNTTCIGCPDAPLCE